MKVGILTYHWEDNYGATMQAYATMRAVEQLGHEPFFIDLRLPYAPSIAQRVVFALKRHRFNGFRRRNFKRRSPKIYTSVEELRANPPKADCYLTGSDQTWNPQIAKKLLPAFFLDFGPDAIRRVSYATSIGLNEWEPSPAFSDDEIRRAVERYGSLLLRETSALQICKETFGREAKQVCDPVLLFPEYSALTGPIKPSGEAVVYKLIDDAGFYDIARETAQKLGLPVRSIGSVRKIKGFRSAYPESVENWISRFAESEVVMTDSFHGTVFSLLYHRPFVIYIGDPNRVTRIKSLLDLLGLSDRILSHGANADDMHRILTKSIDWADIDRRLSDMRSQSFSLLDKALS